MINRRFASDEVAESVSNLSVARSIKLEKQTQGNRGRVRASLAAARDDSLLFGAWTGLVFVTSVQVGFS